MKENVGHPHARPEDDAEAATKRFNVHILGDDLPTLNWMALMRRTYAEAARELCLRLPPSRERSTALIKLEEAMFWTSAAAAREHGTPTGYGDIPTGAAGGGIVGSTSTRAAGGLRRHTGRGTK